MNEIWMNCLPDFMPESQSVPKVGISFCTSLEKLIVDSSFKKLKGAAERIQTGKNIYCTVQLSI